MRRSSSRSSPAPRGCARPEFGPHSWPATRLRRVAFHPGPPFAAGPALRTQPALRAPEALIVRTAFVATYPPRRCGIASFTHDLAAASGNREIAVLHPPGPATAYPLEVHHRIRRDEPADYRRTAEALNRRVDVVSIQHEYGIWGGDDGDSVIDFARALRVPVVATLHTVLSAPTPRQRSILVELTSLAEVSVVMSRSAANLLIAEYDADPRRLQVIPHGVPNVPLVDSASVKPGLGVAGRAVILSFGLLGPGKGYELAIEALPAIAAAYPEVLYVIVGATHPDLVAREGEAYRRSLQLRVAQLGLASHVRFVDRFVGRTELVRWLEAADVFVTPYPNLGQIVSGTLSYAMGAGRTIVSTPYTYAVELLANGRGVLVPPGSAPELGAALGALIGDPERRAAIGQRAHAYSRRMVWSAVGGDYRALFDRLARAPRGAPAAASVMPAHA